MKRVTNWRTPAFGVWLVGIVGIAVAVHGAENQAAGKKELPPDPQDQFAYALGVNLAGNLKQLEKPFTEKQLDLIKQGYLDAVSGAAPIDQVRAREIIRDFQRKALDELAERNLKKSRAFLEQNKSQPGVKTTSSGLQYMVIKEGEGEPPDDDDIVTVHYRGTLIDGTEFDSSYKRGKPTKFVVGRTIRGWREALKMMKPGAKWKLWIPPELGYGRMAPPNIGPNQALIFEVELIEVERQQSKQTSSTGRSRTPITSDIIRIPSKEELEKGAKPEVIKPEELKKLLEQQQKKNQTGERPEQ